MTNEFATEVRGFSTFQDVDNRVLRGWNQYNVLSNMHTSNMDAVGEEYLESLSKGDKLYLYIITEYVKEHGREATGREIQFNQIGLVA